MNTLTKIRDSITDGALRGLIVLMLALIVPLLITATIYGFVLMQYWNWFVIPTFGLATLSFPAAAGIVMLVLAVTYHAATEPDEDDKKRIERGLFRGATFAVNHSFNRLIVAPVSFLLVGWIIQLFV